MNVFLFLFNKKKHKKTYLFSLGLCLRMLNDFCKAKIFDDYNRRKKPLQKTSNSTYQINYFGVFK